MNSDTESQRKRQVEQPTREVGRSGGGVTRGRGRAGDESRSHGCRSSNWTPLHLHKLLELGPVLGPRDP